MKRQIVFASSLLLALAAGAVSFTSTADAAVVRHHGGGHSMGRSSGGHAMARFNSGGGHRYAYHRGYGHRWARGGGGYYYGGYDYCGPVQLALGICTPYYYAPYGPFGIL